MREAMGEKGFFRGLLVLALMAALIYVGLSFARPYYRYLVLGSHTRDLLKMEIGNVDVIKEKVLANAAELKIPLKADDLDVSIEQKIVRVKARWSETVDLMGHYQKKIMFDLSEEY